MPVSRKAQREQARDDAKARSKEKVETSIVTLNAATKRKRSDVDEADPKLKEFLEVMQPASKPKKWNSEVVNESEMEPPTKMQALELPEGESDDDYEVVPKKARKRSPSTVLAPAQSLPVVTAPEPTIIDEQMVDAGAPIRTDDDWLRSRTNRLLDLMDPEDIIASGAGAMGSANVNPVAETSAETSESDHGKPVDDDTVHEDPQEEDDNPDPVIEAIKTNGRLFVRNLPYTATEEDLREHFQPYGTLEEVRPDLLFHPCLSFFMMNIQIGTAYATACDVNWTKILVDASYFLKEKTYTYLGGIH